MATGSYDANGIWQYGEDDNIALFSDLLNLATESTSDAFTDDRARLATLEEGSLAGLIPVVPASVDKTGGSAAVNALGTVTFTGVSSFSLNGIFSTNYRNYRFVLETTASVSSGELRLQMRAAGTNTSSGVYDNRAIGIVNAYDPWTGGNETFTRIGLCSPTYEISASVDVITPNVAKYTIATMMGFGAYSTNPMTWVGGMTCKTSTQYDGITIYPSNASVLTGTITVYGYND